MGKVSKPSSQYYKIQVIPAALKLSLLGTTEIMNCPVIPNGKFSPYMTKTIEISSFSTSSNGHFDPISQDATDDHDTKLKQITPGKRIPVRITTRTAPSNSVNMRSHTKSNCIYIKTNEERPKQLRLPIIMLANVCHIANKIDELYGVVANNNPEVVLITESWLTSNIPDSAITIGNEYTMFRRDRPTPGGEVLAYVHQNIPVTRLMTAEEDNKEVLWQVRTMFFRLF